MSYWVSFCLNDENETEIWSRNCTVNVAPMWSEALQDTLRNTIEDCDQNLGMLSTILGNGISSMERTPDIYREMTPKNGWGTYESALSYLKEIKRMCDHLKGAAGVRIHVSS